MRENTARLLRGRNDLGIGRIVISDPASVTFAAKPLKIAAKEAEELLPKEIDCCNMATD